jgi:uncharacterized protein
MKLHADTDPSINQVTAYGEGWVEVNRQRHAQAVHFSARGPVLDWPVTHVGELTEALLDELRQHKPEVVILGTGARQQFLKPALLRGLLRDRIGVECMDTQAAARTYNILASEGRAVTAALLPL